MLIQASVRVFSVHCRSAARQCTHRQQP
jgi:hypothetical protein